MRWRVLLLIGFLNGCALQATLPAHHVDSGKFAITAAITEPGVIYIPKVSAAATVGVGGFSDFTLGFGTALLNVTAFSTIRFWTKWFEASVEGHFQSTFLETGNIALISLTPRAGKGLTEDEGFAFGAQLPILWVRNEFDGFERPLVFGGGYVTYGWRVHSVPWLSFQTELAGSPLLISRAAADEFDSPVAPWVHVNFGASFWPGRTEERAPPEEEPEVEQQRRLL